MVLRVSGQTPKQPHRGVTGEDAAEEPANYLSEDRGCERLVQFLQLDIYPLDLIYYLCFVEFLKYFHSFSLEIFDFFLLYLLLDFSV